MWRAPGPGAPLGPLRCCVWPSHKAGQFQNFMQLLLHAIPWFGACCHAESFAPQMSAKGIGEVRWTQKRSRWSPWERPSQCHS